MDFKKKREKGRKNKKWQKRGRVTAIVKKVFLLELWPAIWRVERRSFHLKFGGVILLGEMNNSTMVDLDFNYWIRRYVVGEPNPKTLINAFFLGKKIVNLVIMS